METINLFLDHEKKWLTNVDLYNTLCELGANDCDVLFIHSSLSFGTPNPLLKKKQLLQTILDVIYSLGVKTICMPTFTFSFCNGEDYNVISSNSRMGVLNEFFRKQEGVVRSVDPLMSVALRGEDKYLVENIGHASCGANSTYDKLHHRGRGVKFLMLGAKIGDCMTYMHYMEWLFSVDYRYERAFEGLITNGDKTYRDEYLFFPRYKNVIANANSYVYEERLYKKGLAKISQFGDSSISVVGENEAVKEYLACLQENPYFFVDLEGGKLIKEKTYAPTETVVAM